MNEADALYKLFFAIMMVAATQGAPSPATPSPIVMTPPAISAPATQEPGKVAQSVMGVEFHAGLGNMGEAVQRLNAAWVRINGLMWADVEHNEGERKWETMASLEAALIAASQKGAQVVLVVRRTPLWAQSVHEKRCSAPRRDKLDKFAAFMNDAVARYSKAPYNVKYWEIGNEVDATPEVTQPDDIWGCWGDSKDAFYGGGYYADILKAIYPAMKRAAPATQVLVGGLLLDCPPSFNAACRMSLFMEGILRNGGSAFFDGVGFHAYDGYQHRLATYAHPSWQSAWDTTGPAFVQKLRFLRDVLNRYNVQGKYFMMTEGSVLCWACSFSPADHETTKAYYVPQMFGYAMANQLRAVIWYSYNSQWEYSPLVDGAGKPLPAHTAMQVLHSLFGNAVYMGPLTRDDTQNTSARGFKFMVNGKPVWMMWLAAQDSQLVTLPAAPAAITDVMGNAQPASRAFVLTTKPLYIAW